MDVIRAIVDSGWRGYEVIFKPNQIYDGDGEVPKRWTGDAMVVHEKILRLLRGGARL